MTDTAPRAASREPAVLLAIGTFVFVLLGVDPVADRLTWFLENAPAVAGGIVLVATCRRFPLTPLAYRLVLVHAVILMVGGHWTYAEVPWGDAVRDALGLDRNPYDRLGHLAQGFVPALLAREVLLRTSPLRRGGWLAFIVVCICMAISLFYELIEWWAALLSEQAAEAFLGTQGDPWDTQWDMFLATVGAVLSLLVLSRIHDRQLAALGVGGE